MMRNQSVWLIACASLPFLMNGCGVLGLPAFLNLSGFDTFRFESRPGLGFCLTPGSVLSASIQRNEDGTYTAQIEFLEAYQEQNGGCPDGWDARDYYCLDMSASPERVLTDAEVEDMRSMFRFVPIDTSVHLLCLFILSDPCLINSFAWDDLEVGTLLCSIPRLDEAQATEILDLLETIGAS